MEITEKDAVATAEERFKESVAEPTQAPSEGYEWVSFPEGYWAERKKHEPARLAKVGESPRWKGLSPRRYSESASPSSGQNIVCGMPTPGLAVSQTLDLVYPDETSTNLSPDLSPSSKNSTVTSRKSGKLLRGLHYLSPTYPHFVSPTGEPEGLYCKTKRGVETGLGGKHKEV
jgi:parafibromin